MHGKKNHKNRKKYLFKKKCATISGARRLKLDSVVVWIEMWVFMDEWKSKCRIGNGQRDERLGLENVSRVQARKVALLLSLGQPLGVCRDDI